MSDPDLELQRQQMLRVQLRRRGIHDPRVLAAMARTPRERFLPEGLRSQAYADRALPIACNQTISQPYIVALMSQALGLSGGESVLEIGTGSGYQAAVLAELAREVVTVERHAELSQQAGRVLEELGYRNVTCLSGDGTLGWKDRSPYDRIMVTAAALQVPPALLEQLGEGGVMVIPLGPPDHQVLQAIRKVSGRPSPTSLAACRFVPLVRADGEPA